MDIILLQEVENLGDKHQLVSVKSGYARNYLIPRGMALIANVSNRKRLLELVRAEAAKEAKLQGHYEEIAAKLKGTSLKIGAKAGATGKIFGSVTSLQVVQMLKEQHDVEVERKKIEMPDEVKELGKYTAKLNLHADVQTEVEFEVVQE